MYNLTPGVFKSVMKTTVMVSVFCEIIFLIVLIIMVFCGMFEDIFSAVYFASVFLLIIPLALIPCLWHYKTSQSSVEILSDRIKVLDKNGTCWREICYDTITYIGVESISGFFYGQDHSRATYKYICMFLNGHAKIPNATYSELFKHKDFFMLCYAEDALDLLLKNYQKYLSQKIEPRNG